MSPETIMFSDAPKSLRLQSIELTDNESAFVYFEFSFPADGETPAPQNPVTLAVKVDVDYLDKELKLPDLEKMTRRAAGTLRRSFIALQEYAHSLEHALERP